MNSFSNASFGANASEWSHKMKLAEITLNVGEDGCDVFIAGHIARVERRVSAERGRQFLDVVLYPFALVGEGELGAGVVPRLGDGPCNGAVAGKRRK